MAISDNVSSVGSVGVPAGSSSAPKLARKLRLHDYFALAFGTMIGTGWVVLMDDWLGRGGPLGAILGFVLGGIVLIPVGYVYGQWVLRLPDAAGEAAYTAQVFPPVVSYFTGWIMLLAYSSCARGKRSRSAKSRRTFSRSSIPSRSTTSEASPYFSGASCSVFR